MFDLPLNSCLTIASHPVHLCHRFTRCSVGFDTHKNTIVIEFVPSAPRQQEARSRYVRPSKTLLRQQTVFTSGIWPLFLWFRMDYSRTLVRRTSIDTCLLRDSELHGR